MDQILDNKTSLRAVSRALRSKKSTPGAVWAAALSGSQANDLLFSNANRMERDHKIRISEARELRRRCSNRSDQLSKLGSKDSHAYGRSRVETMLAKSFDAGSTDRKRHQRRARYWLNRSTEFALKIARLNLETAIDGIAGVEFAKSCYMGDPSGATNSALSAAENALTAATQNLAGSRGHGKSKERYTEIGRLRNRSDELRRRMRAETDKHLRPIKYAFDDQLALDL